MNAHSTPEASPQYPHPLPDSGPRCAEWALDTLFGSRKPGAWLTVVHNVDDGSQWEGGRYLDLKAALETAPNAGHYISVGIVKPGATRRLNTTTEAGACIFFDDVGEIGVNPNAKMDKAWLDLLGPTPTFVVATSEGNFQYFYAFSEPVPAATQQKLFDALKANPDTHGGFIEGNALIRYGRLPSGKNPKPGRGRFSTQLVEASGRKYSVNEIVRAFSLKFPSMGAASPGMSASQSGSASAAGEAQEPAGEAGAASGQDDAGAKAFGHYVYRQTFIGQITQLAIANTEAVKAWFPELFPAAWDYQDGQRVYSRDIGRPHEEDISVLPLTSKTPGIKDFAVHDDKNDARQGKRTAVDLVLEWGPKDVRGSFQDGAAALAAALWLADRLGLSEEEIETIRAKAASAGPSTPMPENVEPIDLWPSAGALPPLPVGLLPKEIETFARAAAIVVGADDGGFAMAALAVAAGSLDDAIKLSVMPYAKWVESARIWVALVGDPSTKKTPIINTTYEALKSADKALYRFYAAAKAKWEMLSKPDKATTPAPVRDRYLISDTTSEAAQEAFRTIGERGLFGVYDELGGFFGSMERYGQNGSGASERRFWLEAYNGGSYLVDRIGRGSFMIANLSLTILGGIQPDLIRKVASAPSDDGLIQRIIPIVLRPGWTPVADQNAASQMGDFDALVPQLLALCPPNAGHLSFDAGAQKIRDDLAKSARKRGPRHGRVQQEVIDGAGEAGRGVRAAVRRLALHRERQPVPVARDRDRGHRAKGGGVHAGVHAAPPVSLLSRDARSARRARTAPVDCGLYPHAQGQSPRQPGCPVRRPLDAEPHVQGRDASAGAARSVRLALQRGSAKVGRAPDLAGQPGGPHAFFSAREGRKRASGRKFARLLLKPWKIGDKMQPARSDGVFYPTYQTANLCWLDLKEFFLCSCFVPTVLTVLLTGAIRYSK